MKQRTRFGYSMWSTGKAWAVHVWSPRSYARMYGFASPKEAAQAALEEIAGMKRAPAVTRERWFCFLCGALTQRGPDKFGHAYCRGHANLRDPVDFQYPDPFESLPMQAAQLREDMAPRKGKAI